MRRQSIIRGNLRRPDELHEVVVADLGAPQQFERGAAIASQRHAQHTLDPFPGHVRGPNSRALEPGGFEFGKPLLLLEERPALLVDQSQLTTDAGEPEICVVLSEQQPVLRAAGEHAVGLARAPRYQVVDQNSEVRLASLRHPRRALAGRLRGVDARHQPLGGGLFISCRAVDLPCEEQPGDDSRLERGLQVSRVEEVVLDRVAGPGEVGVLETADGAHELVLHVERQARGDAVRVDFVRPQSLGLHEDLVGRLVGEADDFVLDGRAVARTHSLDDPGEHRGPVGGGANDLVGSLVCLRNETIDLIRMITGSPEEREYGGGVITRLGSHQ